MMNGLKRINLINQHLTSFFYVFFTLCASMLFSVQVDAAQRVCRIVYTGSGDDLTGQEVCWNPGGGGGINAGWANFLLGGTTSFDSFDSNLFHETSGSSSDGDGDGEGVDTSCEGSQGNPILMSNGNKVEIETDFIGNETFPLAVVRVYNNKSGYSGIFGTNWLSNIDNSLFISRVNPNGPCKYDPTCDIDAITKIQARRFDGKIIQFHIDSATGEWRDNKPDSINRIVEQSNGEYVFYTEHNMTERYSSVGKLLEVKNTQGLQHTYTYSSGKLSKITHSSGRVLTFSWNSAGKVSLVKDNAGNAYSYAYSGSKLTEIAYPISGNKEYYYENSSFPNALTGVSIDGQRYSWFSYDSSGKAIESRHYGNADKHLFSYSTYYTLVTNPLGHQTKYIYSNISGQKLLTKIERNQSSNCSAGIESITYDEYGFQDKVVDWNGNITDFDYNYKGQLIEKTIALGTSEENTISYEWDEQYNRLLLESDSRTTVQREYNSKGLLTAYKLGTLESTVDMGHFRTQTYSYTFHTNNMVASIVIDGVRTDVDDHKTLTFDTQGNLLSETNALGQTTTYSNYDALGRSQQISYPDGRKIKNTFSPRGQLLKQEVIGGTLSQTSAYEYNTKGLITKKTQSNGDSIVYEYDRAYRLSREISSNGDILAYTLNNLGNVIQKRIIREYWVEEIPQPCSGYSNGDRFWAFWLPPCEPIPQLHTDIYFSQSYVYDELGRVLAEKNAEGALVASYTYDDNGNVNTTTDGNGKKTQYFYNALDQISKIIDAYNKSTNFEYTNQYLTKVIDSRGNTTVYQKDSLGNILEQTSPDSGISRFTISGSGLLLSQSDALNNTRNYSYDKLGRVLSASAGGTNLSWGYDNTTYGKGKLTSFADSTGNTRYTYDAIGQLKSQIQVIGNSTYTTIWGYDSVGRLKTVTYPGGNKANYSYNERNQIIAVTATIGGVTKTVANQFYYRPLGPASSFYYGNGLQRKFIYDQNYMLIGLNTPNIQQKTYYYDANNNIKQIQDTLVTNYSQNLSYDPLNRLITSTSIGLGNHSYSYDTVTNRQTQNGQVSESYNYSATSNRLNKISKGSQYRTLSYDPRGNVVSERLYNGTTRSYGYNYFNRMVSAGIATYKYNALGQRVVKKVGSTETHFIFTTGGQLLSEGTNKQYIYLDGRIVAYILNNQLYYVHNDHLGRPEVLTNASKAIVWKAKLDNFNRIVQSSSIGEFNLGFPGQYWDSEKGSYYNMFRDYDPETGRYLQSDPIGLEGGMNTYAYVGGNPVIYIDRDGLKGTAVRPNPVRPGREPGWTFQNRIKEWNATRDALARIGKQSQMVQQLIQSNGLVQFNICYCDSTVLFDFGFDQVKAIGASQCTTFDQDGNGANDFTGGALKGCTCY
jgi:RHS repeat-associated protein